MTLKDTNKTIDAAAAQAKKGAAAVDEVASDIGRGAKKKLHQTQQAATKARHSVEEAVEKAGHEVQEIATRAKHAAREVAQLASHELDELSSGAAKPATDKA